MLTEVADGVLIRQSEFCLSNAILVRGAEGLLVIDPGVDGADFDELTEDIRALGDPVLLGFSTHPHWDHLLWDRRLGDVPRYGTEVCATAAGSRSAKIRAMAQQHAPGIDLSLVARATALPAGADRIPWSGPVVRIIEHRAHAPGHAALLIEDAGVLVAGDMLSDVEMPLLDPQSANPCGDYASGLARLALVCRTGVDTLIPGHGGVAQGEEITVRLEADGAYLDSLRVGAVPADPRIAPEATYGRDWLPEAHERNIELARREYEPDLGHPDPEAPGSRYVPL